MRNRRLVIHFLRRFLDNDLISPDADRHEVLAVTFAALSTSGIFLTVLLSIRYLFRPIQSRGWTVMVSLDDTFVWTGLSMIVMALVALAVWDALALDARDTAILGPLPVRRPALIGAQLAAVIIFATVFAVALNAIPSVLAPLIRVSRLPIGWLAILRLVATHAVVSMAAGLFGFVTVLGVRELLRAVLGSARFQQVSAAVQGTLVVLLATSLLLLPALSADVGRRWLTSAAPRLVPPLWFVGLHEALAGDALAGLPAVLPKTDAPAYNSIVAFEARTIRAYEDKQPILAELRRLALVALGGVIAVAAAAWTWNGRRWPALTVPRIRRRGRLRSACAQLLLATLARRPVVAAGFFFTLQTLARSTPHRVVLATTLGVATAAAAFTLRGIDAAGVLEPTVVPLGVFAMQTVVLMVVVTGLRHATRVPADLRASGTFLLTEAGNDRQFLEGVKRAGIVALGCPTIALLFPVDAWLMGPRLASVHAVSGLLLLLILVELRFFHVQGLPLVSRVEPVANVLLLGPLYLVVALVAVWMVASVERAALGDVGTTVALVVTLGLAWGGLRLYQRRTPDQTAGFDDFPADVTQRLNLSE